MCVSLKQWFFDFELMSFSSMFWYDWMYSLGKMKVTVGDLPTTTKNALETAVMNWMQMKDTPQSVSHIMFGLGSMGFKWDHLNEKTSPALAQKIIASANQLNGQVRKEERAIKIKLFCFCI